MDDCSHEWYDVGKGSWSGPVVTTFHGIESTMIRCAKCQEVGYRLVEMAQNSVQSEALFDA